MVRPAQDLAAVDSGLLDPLAVDDARRPPVMVGRRTLVTVTAQGDALADLVAARQLLDELNSTTVDVRAGDVILAVVAVLVGAVVGAAVALFAHTRRT